MKINYLKISALILLFLFMIKVDATIKCDSGKPGDTVNCTVSDIEISGLTANISVDKGLTFTNCDVCDTNGNYSISTGEKGNFKFKISSEIKESKNLAVTIAGETAKIKVNVEEAETPEEISYTVTLIPGNGQTNITQSCIVNSINSTCSITLEELSVEGFNGWGTDKNCTSGSKGNIKVNKDITYYACYKDNATDDKENNHTSDANLLLKSLKLKNQDEEIKLGFSMRIFSYEITVPSDTQALTVEAIAQNEDVKVNVTGHDNLSKDNNEIKIILTNDNKTNEYTIKVTKSDNSKSPVLSNLIIGGYTIDFNPEKYVYSIKIDSGIKKLNIEPTVDNENLKWDIVGNENLKNKSQIKVVVTDTKTNNTSTYIINIEQESFNLILFIGIGTVLLILLIILLIIVVKKGKSKNNKTPDEKQISKMPVKPVNSQENIPEVQPAIMTPPTGSVVENTKELNNKEDLEVLDL